ncbi:Ribonuclease H protein [Senna tora]|uniref:Ribonuclease H protein n=1 Tax=Senna tora TaxID=362788 RepID=A0A834TLT8_9FABA|nr:Ribonuclease H protein [Senna tora]
MYWVRFWSDPWLPNGVALCNYSLVSLSDADLEKVAADFVSPSGGWEWGKFEFLLPNEVCRLIAAVSPPSCVLQGDHLDWKHSRDGVFSTRKRRGIAVTDTCPRCDAYPERLNLGWHGSDWGVIFAYACWYIWRMRNAEIFDGSHIGNADPVFAILKLSADSSRAFDRMLSGSVGLPSHVQRFICWKKPSSGWVKFNVDVAKRESLNLTACGGIARDSNGRFLIGFMRNLGDGLVLNAELWGIVCALEVAWRSKFKKVLVESDCLLAVKLVNDSISLAHPCSPILSRIHYWIARDWEVQVVHIHREGNCAADAMAGHALGVSLDLNILNEEILCLVNHLVLFASKKVMDVED